MTAPVQPGEVLAGKFRVERILGMGGMGVVVSAWHLQLEERVALKFMLPEALANEEAVARFSREARAAVKIKSEHVARVSDVGKLENGAPYMVMEFLEGEDLHQLLHRVGPLPVEQAVEYVLQACEAIAEAHSIGIVHRDLKPSNLFVIKRRDGGSSVKVLDFGISKANAASGSSSDLEMTKTSAVLGSPLYMSPEQLEASKNADQRSDIWAIGITLYELLCKAKPFGGDTLPELVLAVMSKRPVSLETRLPGISPRLEAVILKCLEKDRGRRYQTVAELANALAEFGPPRARTSVERISGTLKVKFDQTAAAEPPSLSPLPTAPPAEDRPGTAASWAQTQPKAAHGARNVVMAGLAVLLVAGVVYGLVQRSRHVEGAESAAASTVPATAESVRPPEQPSIAAEPAAAKPSPAEQAEQTVTVTPAASAAVQAAETKPPVQPPPSPPSRPISGKKSPVAAKNAERPGAPPARPTVTPAPNSMFDDRK